jgi:hypothetical protein
MNGRKWVRLPYIFALIIGLGLSAITEAKAQSPSSGVVACIDGAANELKTCVDDLPWYQEAACYLRYASDGILCAPSVVFRAV